MDFGETPTSLDYSNMGRVFGTNKFNSMGRTIHFVRLFKPGYSTLTSNINTRPNGYPKQTLEAWKEAIEGFRYSEGIQQRCLRFWCTIHSSSMRIRELTGGRGGDIYIDPCGRWWISVPSGKLTRSAQISERPVAKFHMRMVRSSDSETTR